MANFKIKIDGKKFTNSFLYDFKGQTATKRCLCIPIDDNNFFVSDKTGSVYIDLIAFETREPKDYSTHIIKQSFPKAMLDALTDEQRKALPIIGNLVPSGQPAAPTQYAAPTPGSAIPAGTADGQSGDLPF